MVDSRRFSKYKPLARETQNPPDPDEQEALQALENILAAEFQVETSSKWVRGHLRQERFRVSEDTANELLEMRHHLAELRDHILQLAPESRTDVHPDDMIGINMNYCHDMRNHLLPNIDELLNFVLEAEEMKRMEIFTNPDYRNLSPTREDLLTQDLRDSLAEKVLLYSSRIVYLERDVHNVVKIDMLPSDKLFYGWHYEYLLDILLGVDARLQKFWNPFLHMREAWDLITARTRQSRRG